MSEVINELREQYKETKTKTSNCLLTLKSSLEILKETDFLDYPEYDKDAVEWSIIGDANWNITVAKELVKLALKHLQLAGEAILIDEPSSHHVLPLELSASDMASVYISTEGDSPRLFLVLDSKD